MNKIYKVVWNKIRNCYVVVSEVAKARSKGGSTVRRVPRMGAVLTTMLLASVLSLGISAPVWADGTATITGTAGDATLAKILGGNGISVSSEGGGTITISAEKNDTLEFLKKYMKFNTTYPDSTPVVLPVVDDRSKSSFALGQGTQIGVSADDNTSENNLAIGTGATIFAGKNGKNTALGTNAVTGFKGYQTTDGIYTTLSTALGSEARVYGSQGVSIGENAQIGTNNQIKINDELSFTEVNRGVAIGSSAKTWSDESVAIGPSAEAGTNFSTKTNYKQLGDAESQKTKWATAVGYTAKATAQYSAALGAFTTASGQSSSAIGYKAQAKNSNSTAIGSSSNASGSGSSAIGYNTKATNTNGSAIGSGARAFGQQSSAIGASNVAVGRQNVAIGTGSEAKRDETMALGFHAAALDAESISVGHDTVTFGDSSLAIGHLAFTGMPVREGRNGDTKYIALPLNSKVVGPSKLYFQTSDGTVLLCESSINDSGAEKYTYYKVKAKTIYDDEGKPAGWEYVKVDKNGNEAASDKDAVQYLVSRSKAKDVRDPQFDNDKVLHVDYYYQKGENQSTTSTKTEPLDGGIAIGSYTVAQGEHSLALGLTAAAYGKNSMAQGLYSNAFGEGAIAFGHETTSGGHVAITPDLNIEDAYTTEFSVTIDGIANRTLADGSVAGLDKNNVYSVGSGANKVEINSLGKILSVGGTAFNYDKNKITLASDKTVTVTRDDLTGYYFYEKEGKKVLVGPDELLTFTDSDVSTKTINIAAGKMTLSSGGISFGSYSHAEGDKAMAIGRVAGAYGRNSTAVGQFANSLGEDSMAIGHNASAGAKVDMSTLNEENHSAVIELKDGMPEASGGKAGIAIGSYSHAAGDKAVAIGRGNIVTGDNSIAIGTGHTVSGSNSGAFGDPTTIKGNNSYSVGNNNTIDKDLETDETATEVFAVGNSITTVTSNSAFLGDNAAYVQAAAKLEDGTTGGLKTVEKANINGFEFGSFAGAAPVGVVSVGAVGDKAQRRIQNVAAGLISAASTDAINGSQLYAAIDAMQFDIVGGDNVEVIKETSNGHTKYTIHSLNAIVQAVPNNTVTVEDEVGTGATNGKTTDLTPESTGSDAGNGTGAGTTGGTTVTTPEPTPSQDPIGPLAPDETKPNNHTTTYTVDAADSKVDGVKVTKGDSTTKGNTTETEYTVTVTSKEQSVENGEIVTKDVEKSSDFIVTDTRNKIVAGENITVTASGDDEKGPVTYTISAQAATNVKVIDGENTTVTEGKDGDFTTYAVNVKTDGKVAPGNTGIVTGDTVYKETRVEKDGNYIKKDNTAAENITELDKRLGENTQNITNIYNDVNKLDNRMRKGLAGAAALAALHPMDFNPDDKLQFSAGVGNYRGETAAALGAFYRPDESVMFSIGGTFGNADNMVNAGITFGLDGTRNRITRSRTAMAREIQDLRSLVTQMAARMDRLEGANSETAMFPDVPENHWAYEYVEDLQKRGALKGYPDGLFKGDRAMTRYEFAAMLDRLVRSGVMLDSKIAKEFEPELGRIYVERISGQDNDRKKVERVRVNNSDSKYPEGKTRDVYGSKIVTEVPKTAEAK